MGKQLINLTGQRFGRLTVLTRAENNKRGNTQWLCQCDCGEKRIVLGTELRGGRTRSCGCLRTERLIKATRKHGASKTRLYSIYHDMLRRCYDCENKRFSDYGGRGIKVCEEWKNDFSSFQLWALSHGYAEDLSIDRIDVNGDYSPGNCRWITMKEQACNKRTNHYINYHGKTKTIAQWERDLNFPVDVIRQRLNRHHWSVEKALTTPPRKRK